jgi:hypothetical protein
MLLQVQRHFQHGASELSKMSWGLWRNVIECHNIVISKNNIGRNFSLDDLAEETCGI